MKKRKEEEKTRENNLRLFVTKSFCLRVGGMRTGGYYGSRGYGRRGRGGGINPFFYYYLYRMYQQYQAVPNKPNGTLIIMAVMASYYFDVFPLLNDIIGEISNACFSPAKIMGDFSSAKNVVFLLRARRRDTLRLQYEFVTYERDCSRKQVWREGGKICSFVLRFVHFDDGFAAIIASVVVPQRTLR